jgi:hypothetical protein
LNQVEGWFCQRQISHIYQDQQLGAYTRIVRKPAAHQLKFLKKRKPRGMAGLGSNDHLVAMGGLE